jgi:Lrp/AsnC family leucine-responsive transcriptional regulator
MEMAKLDAIDRKILAALQENGRLSIAELAEKVGLSPSPCSRRLGLLEDRGVIDRYVAVVNQRAVGLPVSVFVSIKLARQQEDALAAFGEAIRQWPEVVECYLMTGTHDYLMRIVVGSLEDYETFIRDRLSRLTGVASIQSSFALSCVKHKTAVPVSEQD